MRWFGWGWFGAFRRRTPESEYNRGYNDAKEFLASNLGAVREQRLAYWSSACVDEHFDVDGGHYAKGTKAALREAGFAGPNHDFTRLVPAMEETP